MSELYTFSAQTLTGQLVELSQYEGQVLLIVNTASHCGFTPQYAGLQRLSEYYAARGFQVLGFPCNQFGAQEPGDAAAIQRFCETQYGVTFPMFAKIDVNGAHAHPLYRYLTAQKPGLLGSQRIKWNFTKFLVDRAGRPVKRYGPRVKPEKIASDIENLLDA
jgi:glutathione peroxidase